VQQKIDAWFRNDRFDIAVCDFLDAAVNFPLELRVPSVLFQHNVETEIWRRHATTQSNPLKRLMYWVEFRKMLRYESAAVQRFQHVIAVSDHDRKLMSAWVEPSRITVVPTGVDLRNYRPAHSSGKSLNVAFVGAMDWEPNIDGVKYFCEEIWPHVLSEVPEARFRIIGRNPDPRVQKLASSSVEVTGRVPSVLEHLHEAAVVVVPLRIGGGTRLKIYEAMAAGRSVVSTSVGAEGLQVNNGKDIILTDLPQHFAGAVVNLLLNEDVRHQYEVAAAELASHFDWSAIGQSFARVLSDVIPGTRSSGEACAPVRDREDNPNLMETNSRS
jgi:glycosyltransferase involved in cell wall biosynthesis